MKIPHFYRPLLGLFVKCIYTGHLHWKRLPELGSIYGPLREIKVMLQDIVSVCHKYTLQSVLVFSPQSVSYERSPRETAAKLHHVLTHVFLKAHQKVSFQWYTVYQYFSGYCFWKMFLSQNVRPGPGPIWGPYGAHMELLGPSQNQFKKSYAPFKAI